MGFLAFFSGRISLSDRHATDGRNETHVDDDRFLLFFHMILVVLLQFLQRTALHAIRAPMRSFPSDSSESFGVCVFFVRSVVAGANVGPNALKIFN